MIVVPLVLEVIFDLLWHMVVLEGSKPAKSLMSSLRWMLFVLATTESVDNLIQIRNWVIEIVAIASIARRYITTLLLLASSA